MEEAAKPVTSASLWVIGIPSDTSRCFCIGLMIDSSLEILYNLCENDAYDTLTDQYSVH